MIRPDRIAWREHAPEWELELADVEGDALAAVAAEAALLAEATKGEPVAALDVDLPGLDDLLARYGH